MGWSLIRTMDSGALEAIAAAWSLVEPVRATPASSGTQNQTYRLESTSGTFFLRVYSNTDDPRRVRYEHAILLALAARTLSFRVAAPLPAVAGETVVPVGSELAALFPKVEGERVDRSNLAHARACGLALGELHAALREIDLGPSQWVRYGDLERIHLRVADPWALPRELAIDAPMREQLTAILDYLRERIPDLYAMLPQQLCHGDFGPGNLLMSGETVAAVLDFEFAAPDLRAIDVCTGWFWMAQRGAPGLVMDPTVIGPFLEGYAASAVTPLTSEELRAMPDLARLTGAASVIHREGRRRAGLDLEQAVLDRVALLLALDEWLTQRWAAVTSL